MSQKHLYILAGVLAGVGLALCLYKIIALEFPLLPETQAHIWNIEAHLTFAAEDKPVKVAMNIPRNSSHFAIIDENFISRGYGVNVNLEDGNRKAIWSIRKGKGLQSLFYRASVLRVERNNAL